MHDVCIYFRRFHSIYLSANIKKRPSYHPLYGHPLYTYTCHPLYDKPTHVGIETSKEIILKDSF